ncbi:MAG: ribonuclease HII [Chroococcidiopsidaceae cyanobacterium CP_BM_ER_R8_30]|nr:ribonuclease HII [Chroococcidiopsidaceae cyanobacterium CP_BM_ER_R8_30]
MIVPAISLEQAQSPQRAIAVACGGASRQSGVPPRANWHRKPSRSTVSSIWLELSSTLLDNHKLVAGVDEVGRGALFGPVVAAAVILPPSALGPLAAANIKDSKQLSSERRLQLIGQIQAVALDWHIGLASASEIDRLNVLQASLLAMKRAVDKLKIQPDLCLIDGNQPIKALSIPQQTLVQGDRRSLAIASASIVAKVWRDALLVRLASKYPLYDLAGNKGYGTQSHLQALQQYGVTRWHRKSFRPCQLEGGEIGR